MSDEPTSRLYQDAIEKLQAVSADFGVDDATRGAANAQIAALRDKIQDAALDEVSARTPNLQALSSRLSAVLDRAQGGNVSGLQALARKVKSAIGV
jgi:hypothetical protein